MDGTPHTPVIRVAALYVQKGGAYYGLPDVEPWGLPDRDAREYAGPHSVVAHPPCSSWCQLAHINQKRWGRKVGDDGGCFASALAAVRRWGGVLEHPAFSYAWAPHDLPTPSNAGWSRVFGDAGWVCEVSQGAYGHRARKLTWLYYVGDTPPPTMKWMHVPEPSAQVGKCANHGDSPLPRLSRHEASASPPAFRDALIAMARNARLSR